MRSCSRLLLQYDPQGAWAEGTVAASSTNGSGASPDSAWWCGTFALDPARSTHSADASRLLELACIAGEGSPATPRR
ncbi:MAG TPA: hypothetical protein VF944_05105, partial [Candidatus Bathyarchaeia archaeon]